MRFLAPLIFLITSAATKPADTVYDVALDGEARHKLFWTLDYPNSKIKFEVHAEIEDDDWFAVGFSHHGDFELGDYCVYFRPDSGPRIKGIWTDDKCIVHPFPEGEDICTDFRSVVGKLTKFTYSRSFERCSKHHYQIEDGTTHIVWSKGSGPLIGRSLCRRKEGGMTRVQLLKTQGQGAPHPPSTWVYNPTVKNVKVPSGDTTYWCQTVEMPSKLQQKHHVIQAESYLTKGNEGLVHHMEFFHCKVPSGTNIPYYSGECSKKPKALQPCAKVVTAWAMGAKPFVYPKEAGLPVGGPNYTLYGMLEMHYNNPLKLANWVDSSGFKIYMTPDLRQYDAGIMELGLEYVDKMAIPPKQRLFSLSGYCTSECTSVALPENGIMIFGSQLHTHLTGVMIETRHIRQGVELERLNYDYHYSPHFQEIRLLKKQREIRPGDALIQTCFYDTAARNNVTLGGFKTTDEMCVSYNYYYPKIDLEVCKSSISDDALGDYFDKLSQLEDQKTGRGSPISESYGNIEWNPMRVQILDGLYENGPIYMQCNNSAGDRFPGDWSNTPLTLVDTPRARNANKCYDEVEVYAYRFGDTGTRGFAQGRKSLLSRGTNQNMKFLLKFYDELVAAEDEELVKSLYRDFWILPQLSFLFPYWRSFYVPMSVGIFFFHSIMLGCHLVILIYSNILLLQEGNWELVSLSAHYSALVFFGMFFTIIFNAQRKQVAKQHRILYNDVGNYRSGRIYSEQWCVDLLKRFKIETLYFLAIPVFIGFVGGALMGVPYLSKWIVGIENPYTPKGICLNLPIAIWYPFPTHEGFLHFVAVSGQALGISSLGIIIFTCLFMLIHVTQRMRFEFRVIMYSLDTLFSRSSNLYHLMYPGREGVVLDEKNSDYQRIVGLSLRDTLAHHQKLTEMIATFVAEISLSFLLAYLTGLVVIGICLYNILLAMVDLNYGSIVTFVLLILAEVLTMFLLSFIGSLITEESKSLRNELYFIEWYNLDMRNKKTVLNFQTAITNPVVIKGAGIIKMDMTTFSSVMNSAYSFFNLMNV